MWNENHKKNFNGQEKFLNSAAPPLAEEIINEEEVESVGDEAR